MTPHSRYLCLDKSNQFRLFFCLSPVGALLQLNEIEESERHCRRRCGGGGGGGGGEIEIQEIESGVCAVKVFVVSKFEWSSICLL